MWDPPPPSESSNDLGQVQPGRHQPAKTFRVEPRAARKSARSWRPMGRRPCPLYAAPAFSFQHSDPDPSGALGPRGPYSTAASVQSSPPRQVLSLASSLPPSKFQSCSSRFFECACAFVCHPLSLTSSLSLHCLPHHRAATFWTFCLLILVLAPPSCPGAPSCQSSWCLPVPSLTPGSGQANFLIPRPSPFHLRLANSLSSRAPLRSTTA